MGLIKLDKRHKKLLARQNIVLDELRRKETRLSLDKFSNALKTLADQRPATT